jgi:hypothetical protein
MELNGPLQTERFRIEHSGGGCLLNRPKQSRTQTVMFRCFGRGYSGAQQSNNVRKGTLGKN